MKTIPAMVTLLALCVRLTMAQSPVFYLKYDEVNGVPTTKEEVSAANLSVNNQFGKPERVGGVTGSALRTDGFSTWIQTTQNFSITTSMSIDTWVAMESYPSDEEVPYPNLTPSAFVDQSNASNGFAIRINTFGRWWFEAFINGTKYTCVAPNPFPKYTWAHIAAVIDGPAGAMRLYLNGSQVASAVTPVNGVINKANVPLIIGKSSVNKMMGIFLINALNVALDNTRIFNAAIPSTFVSNTYSTGLSTISTTGEQAIQVSSIRFQDDLQRPGYHAMPPANWTNEPHGLFYANGTYHMFYQRTPNGPFKTEMHWGHTTSSDLVNWTNTKDALWPELELTPTTGYDMKGIWSGDVVFENGMAHAFYTCVNHSGPYNPGIAHATSNTPGFKEWTKVGPVIDRQFVNDFRDPYLFKVGTTWYMIIGAAYSGHGGLDCYTSTDLNTWTHKANFCTVPYSSMDIGSAIWEMPVFEPIGQGKYMLIVNPIGGTVSKYGPKFTRAVYWVGTFTNGSFTPDYNQPKNLDVIHGHLSPTVERNLSGQLVGIGMVDERRNSEAQLAAGWCHVFSLPRAYTLLADGRTVGQGPAPELSALRANVTQQAFSNVAVNGTTLLTTPSTGKAEIIAAVAPTTATKYGLNIRVSPDHQEITRLYYDATLKKLVLDKTNSTTSSTDEEKTIIAESYDEVAFGKPETFHVYLDNSIIDVFINEKAAFSARIYPTRIDSRGIELFSEGSSTFSTVNVWSSATSSVPVSGVALNKTTTTIVAGNTEVLSATVSPQTATNKNVTWSTANSAIATVSSTGMVTGVAPGTTTITVKTVDGDFSASCTVNIVAAPTYQIYDFESGNLSGWTPTGSAFSNLDVSTASTYWGGSFNKQGTYHMWGFNDGGDVQTGDMRTTNFILGGDGKVLALISGGNDINNLSLGIYRAADNSLITAVSGVNDEAYVEKILDASAHIGTQCYLKAVDNATGGWGHLNLDNIRVPVQATTVPVTGVTLNKTTMALSVGTAETLVATVAPSNASNINVTWSSGNTAVATVSASGTVNAVSAGSAVITVTTLDGAKTASCTVTVAAPQVLTLDFESGNLSGWTVISGNAFSVLDVCTDVNWGWGGPFNQQGSWHLWGFKDGGDAQVGEIRTPVFTLGANGQVTALIGGGNDINNLYIALCRASDNLVIAKQTGANNEAYSSITLDGSAFAGIQCYVKVVDSSSGGFGHINIDNVRIPVVGTPVNSVSLNKTSTSINVGSSETLIATVLPANATNKNVTWTTSNPSVATVSASGTVTATGVGTAVITVTTQDGAKTASCNVTSAQQYLVLDFESGNLNGWSVFSGNAFSVLDVCTDSGWGWGGPFSQQGSWHLWGFKDGGDAQTGELRSQNFYLGGNGQVTAMIGGGSDLTNLYVALCRASDNFVIAKQTGNNNEAYSTKTLDGASYTGIQCYIRVFDNSTGGFGHLNVDNVRIPLQMAGSASMAGAFAIEDGSSMEGQVRLYPNPATDRIVIEGVSPDELISIVDLVGRVYASKKSDGSTTEIPLDRSKIVPGPYIVRITGGSHAKAAKLIIR